MAANAAGSRTGPLDVAGHGPLRWLENCRAPVLGGGWGGPALVFLGFYCIYLIVICFFIGFSIGFYCTVLVFYWFFIGFYWLFIGFPLVFIGFTYF